jgi:hypothetical protein
VDDNECDRRPRHPFSQQAGRNNRPTHLCTHIRPIMDHPPTVRMDPRLWLARKTKQCHNNST